MAMNCDAFRQKIDAYMDGELSRDERTEMNQHARECEECGRMLEDVKTLSACLAELNEGLTVPLEAQAAWRKAIRAEGSGSRKRSVGRFTKGLAAVAAALVVLVTGTYVSRLNGGPVTAGRRDAASYARVSAPSQATEVTEESSDFAAEEAIMEEDAFAPKMQVSAMGASNVTFSSMPEASGQAALVSDGSVPNEISPILPAGQRVTVRSAEQAIRVADYDDGKIWLENLLSEYDAYFELQSEVVSSEADARDGRVTSAVICVPAERMDDFLMELNQLGDTTMAALLTEDVTGEYEAAQRELAALNDRVGRLENMLGEAEGAAERAALKARLAEASAAAEEKRGEILRQEESRGYARIVLTLTEDMGPDDDATQDQASLGEKMKAGFEDSMEWLKGFWQDALVVLASNAGRLIVWIPAAVLAILLLKWIFGRRK